MDKIYSRKRFLIPSGKKLGNGTNGVEFKEFDKKSLKKLIKTLAILLIAVCIANRVIASVVPVINALSREMARSVATKISNEQATAVMRKL